jgi:demethylmenaquinone methyltransferase/2-methoxy-6-polyprenyl-1,4-benzoquinol methylase/phosphoethanolamine N-methyltransferase
MTDHQRLADAPTEGHVIHWAALYDRVVNVVTLGREASLRRQTVALAELQPDQRVLDVGCGTGTLAIAVARSDPTLSVHGIDPAKSMIERARAKAEAAGVEVGFDVGAVESLQAEAGSYDVVLSSLMMHHLPRGTRQAGLAEIQRVLRPGGRFVVVDFGGRGSWMHRLAGLFSSGHTHPKGDSGQLGEALQQLGFVDLVTERLRPAYLFSLVARKPA